MRQYVGEILSLRLKYMSTLSLAKRLTSGLYQVNRLYREPPPRRIDAWDIVAVGVFLAVGIQDGRR